MLAVMGKTDVRTGHDHAEVEALVRGLPKGARLLGIDLGEKTIGLALSDLGRSIATPRRAEGAPSIRVIEGWTTTGLVALKLCTTPCT